MYIKNIPISAAIILLSLTFISPLAWGANPSQSQIDQATKEVNRSFRKEAEKQLMKSPRRSVEPKIIPPGVSLPAEYTTTEHR